MTYDIFALWDENKTRMSEIPDIYVRSKYLLTRDPVDAKKSYQQLLRQYSFLSMSQYIPSLIIEIMHQYSFFLQFTFALARPYLSRDDEEFYICDNPIRKDKVFKVPMVSGSSWKGNMRWAAGKEIEMKIKNIDERLLRRIQLTKLFGHENEAEKRYFDLLMPEKVEEFKKEVSKWTTRYGLRRGRLNFYPTFFDQINLEVINPHDRKTKAGTLPIYIESVPEDASGTFSLLYVSFDLMGRPQDIVKAEVIKDLDLVYNAIKEMMLTYGFSAKKSSGFGIVDDQIEGTFEISGCPIYKDNAYPIEDKKYSSPFAKLAVLKTSDKTDKPKDNTFSGFDDLKRIIDRVINERLKND